MNIEGLFDTMNKYKKEVSKLNKELYTLEEKVAKEEAKLNKANEKYAIFVKNVYTKGLFKFSLGEIKKMMIDYYGLDKSTFNLTVKGIADLHISKYMNQDVDLVEGLKDYPNKIKIYATFESKDKDISALVFPVDIRTFLTENQEILNYNLKAKNEEDFHAELLFAPECMEKLVINIYPTILEFEGNSSLKEVIIKHFDKNEIDMNDIQGIKPREIK